jgi:Tfp pilus assembly PilM family ATPase
MSGKSHASIGIEFDAKSIRAAKLTGFRHGREVKYSIERLEEVAGDFPSDIALVAGVRAAGEKVGAKPSDTVVTCTGGRQVFMTQVKQKELPRAEMKKALRNEIRKNLAFDSAASSIDYQIMESKSVDKGSFPLVTVTAVARAAVERQVDLLGKAGLRPSVVDVLPAAVCNAFWVGRSVGESRNAAVMLHLSPDTGTLVIDGGRASFFTRNISFAAAAVFGDAPAPQADRAQQLEILTDEFRRSLSYYSSTYGIGDFDYLYLVGTWAQNEELRSLFRDTLGFSLDAATLLERMNSAAKAPAGKFDVAIALAIRGFE